MKYKNVNFVITVPDCDYCYQGYIDSPICDHFDNEGGHPKCNMGFWPLRYNDKGKIRKPKECLLLRNISGPRWLY